MTRHLSNHGGLKIYLTGDVFQIVYLKNGIP